MFAIVSILLLAPVRGAGETFKTYRNARFGYTVSYPATFIPQGESDNGDGQKFVTRDKRASLVVYGEYNVLTETLAGRYKSESRGGTGEHPNRVVTYRRLGDRWFVVSGYEKDTVFYRKTMLKGDTFATFELRYPRSRRKAMDPLISRIARSFVFVNRSTR